MLGGLLHGRHPTRRAHDERLRQAGLAAALSQGAEVARDEWAEVRVGGGRRRALVLAKLGRDLVRRDDVCRRQAAAQLGGDGLLVARIPKREEQGDRHGLHVDLRQGAEIELLEHTFRADALAHAVAALQRDERIRMALAEPVEMRPGLTAEVQKVLEARRADEGGLRTLPLEERVRGDRRPVREALDALRSDRLRSGKHGFLLAPSGLHLCGSQPPVGEENGVGERPAHVDAENRHGPTL